MSESTPTQRPVSRGRTCGLMSCVKHCDILQTPVSERCHTLAVIVMGGSGRLNQRAGDLYYAPQYVVFIQPHAHIQRPTLCLGCQRCSDPHARMKSSRKPHCVVPHHLFFLHVQHLITVSSSHRSILTFPPSIPLDLNITSTSSNLHVPFTRSNSIKNQGSVQNSRKFLLYSVQGLVEDRAVILVWHCTTGGRVKQSSVQCPYLPTPKILSKQQLGVSLIAPISIFYSSFKQKLKLQ